MKQLFVKRKGFLIVIIISLSFIALAGGCRETMEPKASDKERGILIEDEALDVLATKTILFGHMSVGFNIIEGLESLKADSDRLNSLKIQEIQEQSEIRGPGLYHMRNGRNGFPKEKCDNFKDFLMQNSLGDRIDIAFFKFCYVDIKRQSDTREIFDYYAETIDELQKIFPRLTVLIVTTPLMVHTRGAKSFIKNIFKGDLDNIKRNEFNTMLLETYRDSNPVFDLAAAESTLPNGTQVTFSYKGKNYLTLAGEYSSDGGHLNSRGQYWVAKALLHELASLFPSSGPDEIQKTKRQT